MRTYASYHEIGTKFFSTPTIISPDSDAFELQIYIVILQYRCKSPLAMAIGCVFLGDVLEYIFP